MTTIVGGLRARLIHDSLWNCLHGALGRLGWLLPNQQFMPINFIASRVPAQTEVPLNTLALSDEAMRSVDLELGSTAVETRWTYYVDFYAENDVIGKHLIHDIRDVLGGRMSTIGRNDPSVVVYDYRQATPLRVFTVGIENVLVDRAHDFPKPYQQHWYACRFEVVDAFGDEASGSSSDTYEDMY